METLEQDACYHIYNRGIDSGTLFHSHANKSYFLGLMEKHLPQKMALLAFCLMDNHFHLVVRIKEEGASQALANLFNAYAKALNKQKGRSGSLFERPFKRKRIGDEAYLRQVIVYVHLNPQTHGVRSFQDFPFSSYPILMGADKKGAVSLALDEVLPLFEDRENFNFIHEEMAGNNPTSTSDGAASENIPSDPSGFENPHSGDPISDLSGFENPRSVDTNSDLSGFENLTGLPIKDRFYSYIQQLQDTITAKLEAVDGTAAFREDLWERPGGGGGRTRVIENGAVFEKGGVNISGVHGELPESMRRYFGVEEAHFFACGLSLVIHPKNPYVPTVHANWRYFELYGPSGEIVRQWFGGGQDLTPYYLFEEDARHFHQVCKNACDAHDADFYPRFKKECDTYFWNAHRNESRGVGGLFFDRCEAGNGKSMEDWYAFVTQVGDSFLEAYVPIVEARRAMPYGDKERDWQEIRRGRYVEFNLVHDKGTLFGLRTQGRIESILMSLPPHVQWHYDHRPEAGSPEEKLVGVLKSPVNWI